MDANFEVEEKQQTGQRTVFDSLKKSTGKLINCAFFLHLYRPKIPAGGIYPATGEIIK
jgi:hypothetical protein